MADGDADQKRWQDLAEKLADPFVSPFDKPAIARELASMSTDIVQSVQDVAQGKAAPEDALLGTQGKKQLRGARFVARQLREDILPSASAEGQKLVESLQRGSASASGGATSLQEAASELQRQLVKQVDDLTADGTPPKLPTPDEILTEVRNAVQGTEDGLETPPYQVESSFGEWEIRQYEAMLLSTVAMPADGSRLEQGGSSFNTLASFLFGDNSKKESMSMTTPVITSISEEGDSTSMSFVMPSKYDAETLPQPPASSAIAVVEEAPCKVAAIEFPGFATKEEVVRQRDELLKGLADKGWVLAEGAQAQVTVMQYNAPYTLPTVRRNEVLIKLDESWTAPGDTPNAGVEQSDTAEAAVGTDEPQWEDAVVEEPVAEEEVQMEEKVEAKIEEEVKVEEEEEVKVEEEEEVKDEEEEKVDAEAVAKVEEKEEEEEAVVEVAVVEAVAEEEKEEKEEESGKKKKKKGKKKN